MKLTPARVRWHISLALLMFAAPHFAAVAQNAPLIFNQAEIRIDSPAPNENDPKPKPPHAPARYDVEVRGEDALRLEYIHTLNTLSEHTGVMIVFDSPTVTALPAMKVYTPVDVLFIADEGTVLQISPNLVLGEISQLVQARAPVKAFLMLKAGVAAAHGLHPRDIVAGSMFIPPLPVQE